MKNPFLLRLENIRSIFHLYLHQHKGRGKISSLFLSVASLLVLTLLLLPLPTGLAASQDGAVDPGFKSGSGPNSTINSIAFQSDGKIVVGGSFTTYSATSRNYLMRLNVDGSLDTSFNVGGSGPNNSPNLAIQNDGKIVIGGYFTSYNGQGVNRIARLNVDGSLDTSFNVGSGTDRGISAIAFQSDGKIVIGGTFFTYNGVASRRLTRLNADGSLDKSFNVGTADIFSSEAVHQISIQSDGKIVIGGYFTSYNGTPRNNIFRLNADGSLDTSFSTSSVAGDSVSALVIQNNGKVLIGGNFTSFNGTPRNRIARLNADGSLDTDFNIGSGFNDSVYRLAIQTDGKIIIGGIFTSYNGTPRNRIARLNADGSLDTSFNIGSGADNSVDGLAIQTDGKIVIGGYFTSYNNQGINHLARLSADGSLETNFNAGGSGANHYLKSMALQTDGKIIIGGIFTQYNGIPRNYIARLNVDGSLDTSFNVGSGANSFLDVIAIQSDGKILIGGSFTSYNGAARNYLARLNTDGSLDTSFNAGANINSFVYSIAIQNDGKLIVGGIFRRNSDLAGHHIARLNTDGSLDTSFNVGTNINNDVYNVAIQSDGKVLIGGSFTSYNGTPRNRIARLNPDGSLDTSFNVGSGFDNSIGDITIQNDGKILIGGSFTSYNGTPGSRMVRLNTDGSLDISFNVGSGTNWYIYSQAIQSDGKILIGGDFTSFNGTPRNRIARLNTNGSLDTSFDVGNGTNHWVTAIALQRNGKVLIGGYFSAVDTFTRNYIARLENANPLSPSSVAITANPNPSVFGQNVTFTATVTPLTATGSVTFTFGAGNVTNSVAATLVNGMATYVTNTLPVGNNSIQVSYSGDTALLPATSPVYTQTVNKTATSITLASSVNPEQFGQVVTLTAAVSLVAPAAGVPTSGIVTFTEGTTVLGTAPVDANGTATLSLSNLAIGSYTLTAQYSGNASYLASPVSNQVVQIIKPGKIKIR